MRLLRIVQIALWTLAGAALLAAGLTSAGLLPLADPITAATTAPTGIQIGGPFRLISHKGEIVTDADLKGRPFAVFFGFTHCPEVCPTTLYELAILLQQLGPDGDKLRPFFITVDPERDTQAVLADYMQAFDPRITALTGSPAEIEAVANAYKASRRKVSIEGGGYTMDHSALVYLMNKDGRLASTLDPHESKDAQLAKLRRLVAN